MIPSKGALHVDLAKASKMTPLQYLPYGNGMFVSYATKMGTVSRVKHGIEAAKLEWLCVMAQFQALTKVIMPNFSVAAMRAIDRCKDLGCAVTAWAYVKPGEANRDYAIDALHSAIRLWKAKAIVLDIEAPFKRNPKEVTALISGAVELANDHGVSLGITSYGAPWYHGYMPWKAMAQAQGIDFAIPQCYDSNNRFTPGYPLASVRAYEALGIESYHIVTGFGTFGKDLAQFRRHIAIIQSAKAPAICGWKWETTTAREFDAIGEGDSK